VVQGMSLSSFVCYTYESRTSLETTAQSKEVIYWLEILIINASETSSPTLDKTAGPGERPKIWGYQARPPERGDPLGRWQVGSGPPMSGLTSTSGIHFRHQGPWLPLSLLLLVRLVWKWKHTPRWQLGIGGVHRGCKIHRRSRALFLICRVTEY
jgi:hypothetical protein